MKREITLILFINILFINSLFAYNNENKCEDYLSKNKPAEAIISAKSLTSKYDSNFCAAKAKYYQNDYEGAIESFEKSTEHAELQADQMYSILYKGIAQRDNKETKESTITFKHGLETAKLGNSKYMQLEQKFLYQIGLSLTEMKDYFNATDYLAKSLMIAANDDERAESYSSLATAHAANKKYAKSVEFGLKAANTYQRSGYRNKYAEATFSLSRYHFLDGNSSKALSLLESLERFAKNNGSEYYRAKALFEKSLLYRKLNKGQESDISLRAAKRISMKIGASDLMAAYQ
jgi:tetratricopeptide (TPR) repeat protein